MEYFKLNEEELGRKGAIHTAREIWNQPLVWRSTYEKLLADSESLLAFRTDCLKNCKKIVLTGAGTSAYIGDSLEGAFMRHTGLTTLSIPTTHLVTHAEDYLDAHTPTLIVSFARSGNSPESVAAVKRIDKVCSTCYHLIITCDENGDLAQYQSPNSKLNFILPPETNDQSLAMTASYTSMMLAGLLFAQLDRLEEMEEQVTQLIAYGDHMIKVHSPKIQELAKLDFKRVVFLGSGPMFGTSTESSLKVMELSDGDVICKNDSFLGLRHGPKAVIDEKTLVFFLFSSEKRVQPYERDLVESMKKGKKALRLVGVSECPLKETMLDTNLCFSCGDTSIGDDFLAISSVLPAQMLGLFNSMEMGLQPDSPSVSGAISRVVEGVTIYE